MPRLPNRWGWLVISAPLIAWLLYAIPNFYLASSVEERHQRAIANFESEMKRRSVHVWVTENGERYHKEDHRIPEKTHPIFHHKAMERGFTPCLVCEPIKFRKYPEPPVKDETGPQRMRRAKWSAGLVILAWVALSFMPDWIWEQLRVPRKH